MLRGSFASFVQICRFHALGYSLNWYHGLVHMALTCHLHDEPCHIQFQNSLPPVEVTQVDNSADNVPLNRTYLIPCSHGRDTRNHLLGLLDVTTV